MADNIIYGINGPVVTIKGVTDLAMMEMVYVGKDKLIGEVIKIDSSKTTIQVYEETSGIKPGELVYSTGLPMSVTLGPGILSNIFDGIENPLTDISAAVGAFIPRGLHPSSLNEKTLWDVTLTVKKGDKLNGGDVYATTPEKAILHKIMLHPDLSGEVVEVKPDGKYTVNDTVAVIKDSNGEKHNLTLCQKWPIRMPRPIKKRLSLSKPLVTGQRVI
ncbi:MAG: V-type ATP synthase subunit A, partial [Ruminococcus sp.]|nr:V-type ATP synthase subunit A [Candidatus Copronaster equi]